MAEEIAALNLFGPRRPGDPLDDARVVAEYAGGLIPGAGGLRRLVRELGRLTPEERRRLFLKEFHLDQVYHREMGPEQVDRLLKVIRAHVLAGLRYTPRPYPGHVTLFRCHAGLASRFRSGTLGWDALAHGGVTVHDVASDHDALRSGTHARGRSLCASHASAASSGVSIFTSVIYRPVNRSPDANTIRTS